MTAMDDFDRLVTTWLEAEGPTDVRSGVVDTALAAAGVVRQRPAAWGWLAGADRWPRRGPRLAPTASYPAFRVALFVVVVTLTLAVIVAAIAGAIRSDRMKPLVGRNGLIAYAVSDIQSRPYNHVHLANSDGSGDHEIAQGTCPTFSVSGALLSYWSGWAETRELVIANADGLSPTVVPFVKGRSAIAALSPDFTEVAWIDRASETAGRSDEVWVTPVSGGPGHRVAPKSDVPDESYSDLFWSPDGQHLAIVGMSSVNSPSGSNSGSYRSSIYLVNVDGSDLRRLSARPGSDTVELSWSPDGRYLAFDGTPDGAPRPSLGDTTDDTSSLYPPLDVFVIGADGTAERNLTNSASVTERGPEWSPDGSRLAYFGPYADGTGSPLTVVRVAGGAPVGEPLAGPATTGFLWSPDATSLLLLDSKETRSGGQNQTFDSEVRSIDAGLVGSPVHVLSDPEHLIGCVSWQRLEP